LHARYSIYHHGIGAPNHLSPDMTIGLDLGWGGLLEKLRRYRARNRPADPAFYDGEEDLVLGVQDWIARHADLARKKAAEEADLAVRENLEAIAAANEYLVDGPPRTFREACQFIAWFQCVDRMWGLGGALGQIDQLLLPYYEADLADGRETDASIVWHLASLFFNDPHYSQIGGQGPDGRDLSNPLSFRVLEAMHRLRIPSNIALRVYEGMDPSLLHRALEYIVEDGTGVSFALSGGLDAGYCRNGVPLGLARMRAKVGCNWTALPGVEYCLQDVTRVCLVTPLLLALDEVVALPARERSLEALWERYARIMGESVAVVKEGKDVHMARQADNWPEIVLNLFCHGPVERGLDASAGGVDIVDLAMDGIGLATAADSLAAIEQRVVGEGRLTWEDLAAHLAGDYQDAEPVRLMLASVPHYGAGGTRADAWAARIAALWTGLVRDTPTPNGYTCLPGLFSHGGTNRYGERVGATPNGRHAGEPISHSADPDPGFLPGGALAITAKANAVAAVQSGWGNTTPLQIEIDRGLVRGGDALETLEALIMTHNRMGGTLINMNVVSKEQILEAHEDPMTHPDLMIRVTGYSAYFRSLSREYRQPIVDRILAEG
ncbi:MAG: pyruvate-formate lyase, partial [Chloroflexi bacterium]|nr:pyruvate-formate lyase [Chloroflexota bacterium]